MVTQCSQLLLFALVIVIKVVAVVAKLAPLDIVMNFAPCNYCGHLPREAFTLERFASSWQHLQILFNVCIQ